MKFWAKFHTVSFKISTKISIGISLSYEKQEIIASTANEIMASNKNIMCTSLALNPLEIYGANECAIKKSNIR